MSKWTIYKKDAGLQPVERKVTIGGEEIGIGTFAEPYLEYNGTWMGECFITLDFKSPVPLPFHIGDYVVYRNEKFVINYDPQVIKKSKSLYTGDAYTYSGVKFNSLSYELSDMRMLDYVIDDNGMHYSGLPKFQFFCSTVDDLVDRLQVNADRYCYDNHIVDSERWLFITPNLQKTTDRAGSAASYAAQAYAAAYRDTPITTDEKVNQNVSIDNMSVWDSMKFIKDTFGLNFVVRGRVVIVASAGLPTDNIFKYGKGQGLYEIERVADSEQQIVTKLYAYGSDRNMPERYYANVEDSSLPNNLAVGHLMLPGFPTMSLFDWVVSNGATGVDSTTGRATWKGYEAIFSQDQYRPYVMSVNSEYLGMRESTIYFDGSDSTDEIYPTLENSGVDTVYSADMITDNGVFGDGEEVPNFKITLPNLGFDLSALIDTDSVISMKDGFCGGREFPIVSVTQNDGRWECMCQRVKDSGTGLYYPYSHNASIGQTPVADEAYQVRTGDKYVLTGIEMPSTYVDVASERLLEAALAFLSKNDATRYTYLPKVDEIFMARQALAVEGTDDPAYHDILKEGDIMLFEDDDLRIRASIYIDTLRIKEYGNGTIPTYDITLRDDKQVGTIQRIQNQIATLTSTGGGIGGGGGSVNVPQVDALIKAYGSDLFLSKRKDDSAKGKIRFLSEQGIQFGEDFASGPAGYGGRILSSADAELNSLTLRRFLEVPEFRCNRISIQVGNRWRAPGGGIILDVEVDEDAQGNQLNTGTITLHLEDGEIGKVAYDDICMGIFHDGMNLGNNDADDFDDSHGNFKFSGFFTTYFKITQIINETNNSTFRYEMRDDERYTHHPCAMMHFVCYGNFTNPDRQSSRYSTLTYERYLYKVNTWEFGPGNIGAQFGDLTNISSPGRDMRGYSAYLNNIYLSGNIEQIKALGDDLSSYSVDFSDYVDVITIDDVGNVIGGLYKVENNTPYDYRIHSAITVRKNHQVLTICAPNETVGAGKYKIYAEAVRCTCSIVNSTIYITSIENIKDGIPGTPDDVNFDYDAMREMTNCYVNLTIDCEGETTLVKQFPVTIKHMSEPFVDADINNESSGVSWNTKTQAYIGLPIVFDLTMYHNNEVLDITSSSNVSLATSTTGVTLVQGNPPTPINATSIYYSKRIETITKFAGTPNEVTFKVARISINAMGKDVPLVTNIDVTGTAIYAGVPYERTLTHTINKSTDTNVYSVLPIPSEVVVSKTGSLSDNSITCNVICDSSDDKHYTVLPADFSKHNLALRYKRLYTDGSYDTDYQTYNGAVTVNSGMQKVTFYLFGTVNGSVSTSIVHDTEEVPVMASGVDGAGVEYVFWVQESWNGDSSSGMATPTIRDDSALPAFQNDNYKPYNIGATGQWEDEPIGVSGNVGYKYEFYAQRKKANGVWQAFGDVHLWNKYTQSGSSPYVLDLSNDNSLISCDADGNVIGSYETSEIMIFEGGRDAYNDFTVTITPTNITASLSNRIITVSNIEEIGAQVNVQAVKNSDHSIVLTAVYSINKVFPGDSTVIYSLIPSLNVIHKAGDNGSFIDTSMKVEIKKSVGNTVTRITSSTAMAAEGLALYYSQGESSREDGFTSQQIDNGISTSTLCGSGLYTTIYLRDTETGQKLYDRERICVVKDGDTGADGSPGAPGLRGCHERVYQQYIHDNNFEYHNDEYDDTITGIRYVDFMCVPNPSEVSGFDVYMCKTTHPATAVDFEADKSNWEKVGQNFASAYFNYIVAKNAHFAFGSSNQLVIYDSSNNIVGGLTGDIPDEYHEDDSVRIWAGGSNPSTAPFRVQQDGQFYSDKAHIKGLIEIQESTEGIIVYDSAGQEKVQIVAGDVDEPMNVVGRAPRTSGSTVSSTTAYAPEDNEFVLSRIDIPITEANSDTLLSIKAGAIITANSDTGYNMLHATIKNANNAIMKITGINAAPERLSYKVELYDYENSEVVATVYGVESAQTSVKSLDLALYFPKIPAPRTSTYYFRVTFTVDTINPNNTDPDTWGGLTSGSNVTASAYIDYKISSPNCIRIGTNGMFFNIGSGNFVSIKPDATEMRYGSHVFRIDANGITTI